MSKSRIETRRAAAGATATNAGGRRRAFETNLGEELAERLGDALHPATRLRLVRALGAAHEEAKHAIDARASIGVSARKLYAVLQLGARFRDPGAAAEAAGPLSAQVFARLPDDALAGLTMRERAAVAAAVERSEIRAVHPLDWRPRLLLGRLEVYANILAGRDRRAGSPPVTDDRRVPDGETLGLAAILAIAVIFAGLGVWMVGGAVAGAAALFAGQDLPAVWPAPGG